MVHKIGQLGAIKPGDLGNSPPGTEEAVAASAPIDRAQGETFLTDLPAMPPYSGRHHDLNAGIPRGPGYGQAMRTEIPILGDQEEKLWRSRNVRCDGRRQRVQRSCYIGNSHFGRD